MKLRTTLSAATFVLAATGLLASAQAVRTEMAGSELFDPLNLFGNGGVGAFLNPGELTCPGTQPTGDPLQPCPPDSRMTVRASTVQSRLASSTPWLAGSMIAEGNGNLDANGTGPVWGEFRIELDAGGVWYGTWTGERLELESLGWATRLRGVARGSGGGIDGMQMQLTETIHSFTFVPVAYVGAITAVVLDPPSQ